MANTKKGNEKFGVFTDMEMTMTIDHLAQNQKQALVEALFMLNGIATIDMTITLNDGTILQPSILNWEHKAEEMQVLDEEDQILQLENI